MVRKLMTCRTIFLVLSTICLFGALAVGVPDVSAKDTITLKFAFPFSQKDDMWVGPKYMAAELEKKTNGKVKVVPYFSSSLGKLPDSLDMVKTGIADITLFPPAMFPQVFRIQESFALPSLKISSKEAAQAAVYNLYKQGLLDKELEGLKLLIFQGTDPMGFAFKEKITSLSELQKLKMRTPPGMAGKIIELLGCSIVQVPTTGIYMALDRGVADGLVTMPGSYFGGKLQEVAPFWLDMPFGSGACIAVMSQKKWDSIPQDIRSIWDKINEEAADHYLKEMRKRYPNASKRFIDVGATYYQLDPVEASKWLDKTNEFTQKWISDTEAKGYPAKQAIASIQATLKEFIAK